LHGYLPEGVTFGTNAFNLGSAVISGGTWQGGTIQPAYGGTGLTTFVGANNALYSTGSTTLTAGTLPIVAGGTGATTASGALTSLGAVNIAGDTMTGKLTLPAVTTSNAPLNIGDGATTTSPTTPVDGDIWINDTDGLRFRYTGVTRTVPRLEGTNSFSGNNSFTSTFSVSTSTGTISIGTSQTSGVLTAGGTSGTGTITLGRSTVSQTTNIQAGATASGSTKTINFGTGGLSGSTTTMTIGSADGTTVTANGSWTYSGGTVNGVAYLDASKVLTTGTTFAFDGSTVSAPQVRASNGIVVNSQTVSADYTIASGDNGGSFGPVVVASGITVTIASGSVWTVV
jgi:hypothetical protein